MLRILDVGSGPNPKLTSEYLEIEITNADIQLEPPENMEELSYPNNYFDITVCVNALDHTKDAQRALDEIVRVTKSYIYINCAIDQMTRHRKKHYWNAKPGGRFINLVGEFDLKDYGFKIEFEDGRMIAKCSL